MRIRLKRFAAVISPRWREPSTCEACDDQFVCGATLLGCWCSEIKLSHEQRALLRERFEHCVCRNCLVQMRQEKTGEPASGSNQI